MNTLQELNRAADNIRILSAAMVEKAKSGHPGGAMGGADFINVLYSEFLEYDPENPAWEFRDRFFLDPGHMSPMLYSVLACTDKFSMADLQNFRQWGSPTPGHPELDHNFVSDQNALLDFGQSAVEEVNGTVNRILAEQKKLQIPQVDELLKNANKELNGFVAK